MLLDASRERVVRLSCLIMRLSVCVCVLVVFFFFFLLFFFFFNDTATTEIYTLSLHDALPILFSEETAS